MHKSRVYDTFTITVTHNGKCNAIYRTCLSCTKGEINGIIWRGVFCVCKPCFLLPGHKL